MKKTTIYKTILVLIVVLILTILMTNLYVINQSNSKIITIKESQKIKDVDCIIILGSGMYGEKPTPILEERLLKGLKLYNHNISNKILMSGDHGRVEHDEVNLMKKYAIDKGIPSEDIFMDHAGFSTYETMYRAKKIFKVKKAIIVTQKYHMYRSIFIADKLGIEAYGVATDKNKTRDYKIRETREMLARSKDFFKTIFKPSPKYLGEEIPISGSGDLTNDQ